MPDAPSLPICRRAFAVGGLSLFLAACGDSEPAARQAFITFLEERLIAPRGLRIPRLTDEERARFGLYADHYAPIRDFHDTLSRDIAPLLSGASRILPALRRPHDWLSKRSEIAESRRLVGFARTGTSDLVGRTTDQMAALSQPADLRVVFDRAVGKTVHDVVPVFSAAVDGLDGLFAAIDEAAAYLDANLSRMRIVGGQFQTADGAILAGIQERSTAIANAQARLVDLRRSLAALMGQA